MPRFLRRAMRVSERARVSEGVSRVEQSDQSSKFCERESLFLSNEPSIKVHCILHERRYSLILRSFGGRRGRTAARETEISLPTTIRRTLLASIPRVRVIDGWTTAETGASRTGGRVDAGGF